MRVDVSTPPPFTVRLELVKNATSSTSEKSDDKVSALYCKPKKIGKTQRNVMECFILKNHNNQKQTEEKELTYPIKVQSPIGIHLNVRAILQHVR